MWNESSEDNRPLRTGLTTGTCATACAVAGAEYLLGGQCLERVSVTLPKGKTVELAVALEGIDSNGTPEKSAAVSVRVSTIKDAGDDPDVTHGARVYITLQITARQGIHFSALAGVGTVTRDGLALAVGEPAINPVPRQMISDNLRACAAKYGYQLGCDLDCDLGFDLGIGIEQGEVLAQKTMNPRLGIVGGLSILGTTGIVRPFSCAAWIASIHQGIDVAVANGLDHIAASTGNSSEQAIQSRYALDKMALIEMGDFAGAVLKHLRGLGRDHPASFGLKRLSICGGFGKITKLANGHMDLNSRVSAIDFTQLATVAQAAGASQGLQQRVLNANTSIEAYRLCRDQGIDLAQPICQQALARVKQMIPASLCVEVLAINRQGEVIGSASDVNGEGWG